MKSEERQNQMEELLLKSLNGTKTSKNDTTFSPGTIYSTIEILSMYKKRIKPLMHSTDDMKRYLTWIAKKPYVYYSGNWAQLNTVDSLIVSSHSPKNNGSGVLKDSQIIIWSVWAEHIPFS